jgi:uncharacterized membrane protein
MSDRPVFLYAATYASLGDADADYDALLELHDLNLVGTYDVAIINKDEHGKVHVKKHEKPTQHGAWTGIAVGAVAGVLFPPSIIASAVVGGAAGGLIGHLARGMSRGDMKDLGEVLDDGEAALVVVGQSRVAEQLDKALTRAEKSIEREIEVLVARELSELWDAGSSGRRLLPTMRTGPAPAGVLPVGADTACVRRRGRTVRGDRTRRGGRQDDDRYRHRARRGASSIDRDRVFDQDQDQDEDEARHGHQSDEHGQIDDQNRACHEYRDGLHDGDQHDDCLDDQDRHRRRMTAAADSSRPGGAA